MKRLRETTDLTGKEIAKVVKLKLKLVCEYLNSIGLFTTQRDIQLTKEQKDTIKRLINDPNKTRADIVRETGCSDYLLDKYIQMIGKPTHWKRKSLTDQEKSQVKMLATTTTLSRRQIAAKIVRNHHVTVGNYLDSIGIYAKQRSLTEEQKAEIAKLAPDATITHAEIARRVCCKPKQVSEHLATTNAPKRATGKRLTPEQKDLIIKYDGEGNSPEKMAPLVKATPKTIRKYLNDQADKERGTSR